MSSKPLVPEHLLKNPKTRVVAILAYPGVEVLDVTGPHEVFTFAAGFLQLRGLVDHPVYRLEILAERPEPVRTLSGLQLLATKSYETADDIDTLLIPGAGSQSDIANALGNQVLLQWIIKQSTHIRRLVSVCTGAFLLAECGLLEHRNATTHWMYSDQFRCKYPTVKLEPDQIFIRDGSIYTSGGITSGIDLALALVEEDWGRELEIGRAHV